MDTRTVIEVAHHAAMLALWLHYGNDTVSLTQVIKSAQKLKELLELVEQLLQADQ